MSSTLRSPVPGGRLPRIAAGAVERARLTVVPRRRVQAARVPFVTLVTLLLVGGVVGLLLFNTSMQQASFAATSLESQARTLNAREQSLRTDLEDLRDPQRLAEQATGMGMVVPPPPCFLHAATARVEGACTPASAADALSVRRPRPVKPPELRPAPVVVPARPSTSSSQASAATTRNGRGDTSSGNRADGAQDGRQGQHQSQQTQKPHKNQKNQKNQQSARPATRR